VKQLSQLAVKIVEGETQAIGHSENMKIYLLQHRLHCEYMNKPK
jgi:hypothetical protein